jgi:transposase
MRSVNNLTQKEKNQIVELHKMGFGTRSIGLKMNLGRKTIRTLLTRLGHLKPPIPGYGSTKASKLDPFRMTIKHAVNKNLTASRILRQIQAMGYQGQRTILTDLVRTLRTSSSPTKKVFRRFETPPAVELQIDWSPYRVPISGRERIVHAFSAILGYSRKTHVRFYPDERQSTLFEAHVHAFSDFGGLCHRNIYDNMATVVLGRIGKDRKPLWHPAFLEFANYYGFQPVLCRPRDPNRKGKDERFFWYLERDFVRGSEFASFEELNRKVRDWLDTVANVRVHGTTGRVPEEVFAEEKPLLITLPDSHYPVGAKELRTVGPDAVLSIRGIRYTVPDHLANTRVGVRLYVEHFEVLDPHGQVTFTRRYASDELKGRLIIQNDHYQPLHKGSQPTPSASRLEEAFLKRFPSLEPLLTGIKLRMKGIYPIHLRSLIRLANQYGDEVFCQVATQIQQAKRFDSQAVRRLLERDHRLPENEPKTSLTAAARVMHELGEVESGSLDDYAHLDSGTSNQTTNPDQSVPSSHASSISKKEDR